MKKNWAWILITLAVLMAGSFIEGAIAQRDKKFISGNLIVCDHRTPISSLPFTISNPGSYFLTSNLIGSPGLDGISIEADDVTIDLNGFTLTGVTSSVDGIVAPGAVDGITIANGAIADWGADGIDLESAANVRIRDVRVSTCITAFRLSDAVVDACSATGNFHAIFARNRSIFRDCVVKDNGGGGLRLEDSQLLRSTVIHAGTQRALVLDAGQCTVTDCLIKAFGAPTFNEGIVAANGSHKIEGNSIRSGGHSILCNAGATNCIIVKNLVEMSIRNDGGATNSIAPVEDAETSTNPWANLQL